MPQRLIVENGWIDETIAIDLTWHSFISLHIQESRSELSFFGICSIFTWQLPLPIF
jgi:hypothetical protein